jgi:hypothetical protein
MLEVAKPDGWSFHYDGASLTLEYNEDANGELVCTITETGDLFGLCNMYWELISQHLPPGVLPDADVQNGVVETQNLRYYRERYAHWNRQRFNR